jgi:hypothetical protein
MQRGDGTIQHGDLSIRSAGFLANLAPRMALVHIPNNGFAPLLESLEEFTIEIEGNCSGKIRMSSDRQT